MQMTMNKKLSMQPCLQVLHKRQRWVNINNKFCLFFDQQVCISAAYELLLSEVTVTPKSNKDVGNCGVIAGDYVTSPPQNVSVVGKKVLLLQGNDFMVTDDCMISRTVCDHHFLNVTLYELSNGCNVGEIRRILMFIV